MVVHGLDSRRPGFVSQLASNYISDLGQAVIWVFIYWPRAAEIKPLWPEGHI